MHCNTMETLRNKSQSEMNTFEIIATLGMEECQLGRDIRTTFLGDPFCFESTSSSDSLDGTNGEDFDLYGAIRKLRESKKQKKLALENKAPCNQHLKGEYGILGQAPALQSEPTLENKTSCRTSCSQLLKGEYGIFGEIPAPQSEPMSMRMERKMLRARVNALKRESKELEKLNHKPKASGGLWLTAMRHGVNSVYKSLRKQLSL